MIPQRSVDLSSLGQFVSPDFDAGTLLGGYDPSTQILEYELKRSRLRDLIDSMVDAAPTWDGSATTVSLSSALAAIRFIDALPSNRRLPKVAADGEGDVLLVWEPPSRNCIVTVEGDLLHAVDKPGAKLSYHVDCQPFRGDRIPVAILQVIPFR